MTIKDDKNDLFDRHTIMHNKTHPEQTVHIYRTNLVHFTRWLRKICYSHNKQIQSYVQVLNAALV